MRAAQASLLLLRIASHLSGGSSSSFGRLDGASPRAFRNHPSHRSRRKDGGDARDVLHQRGGQQQPSGGGSAASYHGNYIGEDPKGTAITNANVQTTVPAPAAATTTTPAPTPPVLASATSKSSKLSNLQERTGPAVLMLGATYYLLKFTGAKGMIGLVLLIQWAMYNESTSVVEDYNEKEGKGGDVVASFPLQKWWWFANAMLLTSGREMITASTSLTMDQANLITFGMTAVSLVGAVIQLAMISSSDAEDMYRRYLGKVASCHFSLLFLVGQSSFWIKTVKEYGLVWVLFPALLVVVNDTMAYVFGVLIGKHKLIPRLSPKKTVEGFVGAGLSTLAVATPLLRKMIGSDGVSDLKRHALTLALYISLVSPFGGFLASAVKRAHGAKDFGALIPGHGGAVDRFDCQVVTAPFVYLYLKGCLSETISAGAGEA